MRNILTFRVILINVRGAVDKIKRKAIFEFHRVNADILIMYETHSTQECETIWESEWGGKAIFSHGTNQSRGVAVFVTKKLYANISNILSLNDGRVIVFDLKENDVVVTVAGIYAPNQDSSLFFESLADILKERSVHKIVVWRL